MPTRERPIDRGIRLSLRLRHRAGDELRQARIGHGLSQDVVARGCGLSQPQLSRIERGTLPTVNLDQLCRVASVLGLNTALKFYPGGEPLRDQAQINLLDRFRRLVRAPIRCVAEVPMPIPGDQRAWDQVLVGGEVAVGVEAETRIRDCQEVQRRIGLKSRDSGIHRVVLLVADTHANRRAIHDAGSTLREMFPASARVALRELRAGRVPDGSSLILL